MNIGVICAAGQGVRLKKEKPKALVLIKKKPLFIYTLKNLLQGPLDKVLLIVPPSGLRKTSYYLKKFCLASEQKKIMGIIPGGKERQDSIEKGLHYLQDKIAQNDNLLIHNAANIFISLEEIKAIIREADKNWAVAVALPSVDTLREISPTGRIISQLDRRKIWRMQTPQGAKFKFFLQAYQKASREKYYGTDDLELLIRAGRKAKIVPGNFLNFKITYPTDLALAQVILENNLFPH